MSIEEAINLYERQTEELYKAIPCDGCPFDKCKEEHQQLIEWLRELKHWREFGRNLGARLGEYLTEEQIKELEGIQNDT